MQLTACSLGCRDRVNRKEVKVDRKAVKGVFVGAGLPGRGHCLSGITTVQEKRGRKKGWHEMIMWLHGKRIKRQ